MSLSLFLDLMKRSGFYSQKPQRQLNEKTKSDIGRIGKNIRDNTFFKLEKFYK